MVAARAVCVAVAASQTLAEKKMCVLDRSQTKMASAARVTEFVSPAMGEAGVDEAYIRQIYNPYQRMAADYISKDIRERIGDCPAYCYHTKTGRNKSCPSQCYSARRKKRHRRARARTHKRRRTGHSRGHALPAIMQQYAARRRRRRR